MFAFPATARVRAEARTFAPMSSAVVPELRLRVHVSPPCSGWTRHVDQPSLVTSSTSHRCDNHSSSQPMNARSSPAPKPPSTAHSTSTGLHGALPSTSCCTAVKTSSSLTMIVVATSQCAG